MMNHYELRFGTVAAVTGKTAMVRFPGMADPVPVRCVEAVPAVGRKIGCWQTRRALYYLGSGATAGGIVVGNAPAGSNTDVTIRRQSGMSGRVVFQDDNGAQEAWVASTPWLTAWRVFSAGTETASMVLYRGDNPGANVGTTDIGIRGKVVHFHASSVQVNGSEVITRAALKAVVAASTDFADFKTRIAAL